MAGIPSRAALVAGLLAMPAQGIAQDLTGIVAVIDFSQRLEYENDDDNDGDSDSGTSDNGLQSVTRLDFALESATRAETFAFQAGSGIEYSFSGDEDLRLEAPEVALDYVRESRDAELAFSGLFRRVEVDDSSFIEDPLTGDVELATGSGYRSDLEFDTDLSLRRTARIGLELGHSYRRTRYSDISDSSLNDSDFQAVNAALRFRLSPTLTSRLFVNASQRDEDGLGATDVDRYSVGVGTQYIVSPILVVDANVSYDSTEEEELFVTPFGEIPIVDSYEGIGFNVGVSRALPAGSIGVDAQRTQGVNGTRNQIVVSRGFELPRTEFEVALGATKTDGFSAEPLISASLSRELSQRSNLSAQVSQTSQVSEEENESILTRIEVDYDIALTQVSGLSAGIEVVQQDVLIDDQDETTARLDLAYRHALTRDWDFVSGVSLSTRREGGDENSNAQTIFGGLERSFSFRP